MASDKPRRGFDQLIERLHNPAQLRIACTGVMLAVGYLGIYAPLSGKLDAAHQQLTLERERQAQANEVDALRAQADLFRDRIPTDTDTNEWMQFVLDGTRQFSLQVKQMDAQKPQRVPPYEAVVLHLELEGSVHELNAMLHWLETNERLIRVDTAKIAPMRNGPQQRLMQLTILGLKG